MRRFVRWIGIGLGGLLALVIVAAGVLYLLSERILRHRYDVPVVALAIPTDSVSIAEGRRLATIRGCNACHGAQLGGAVLVDEALLARLIAPNLTRTVREYTDAQLIGVIRSGARPDGRGVWAMPSQSFHELSDADLGRILAYVHSMPPTDGPARSLRLGPLGRLGAVTGKFKSAAQEIAETVPLPPAADEQAATGRYLAQTICTECHGTALHGDPFFKSVDLRIVASYSLEDFTRLLRTGVPLGGRKLGMMGEAARQRLSLLTDAEVRALYSYLHALKN